MKSMPKADDRGDEKGRRPARTRGARATSPARRDAWGGARRAVAPMAALAAMLLVAALGSMATGSGRSSAQAPSLGLADLHSPRTAAEDEPLTRTDGTSRPARTLAQGGVGGSAIDLVDLSGAPNGVDLSLFDILTFERTAIQHDLPADGAGHIRLADEPAVARGSYAGALSAEGALAASARTTWPNQASAAYRAEEAARELVLPMLIVDQEGHSSIVSIFNPSEDQDATVDLFVFDPANGALLSTFATSVGPGAVSRYNTYIDGAVFGPSILPPNAAGGFVGALHMESDLPVVAMAYGDQIDMLGTAALGARSRSAAATRQVLPWLRVDAGADALIAVSAGDTGGSPTEVTATFVPADGGNGGEAPFDVAFTLAPRGAAYLDAAGLGRGTVEIPGMPESFRGSLILEADRPILAASLERLHDEARGIVYAASAYNAFAPEELSAGFEVPTLRRQVDFRSSVLHVLNPDAQVAGVMVEIRDESGTIVDSREVQLAAGAGLRLDLSELEAMPRGYGSASLRADRPIAALVGELRDTAVSYPLPPASFSMGSVNMSRVRGTATMTQIDEDVEVVLELDTETSISPAIVAGTCEEENGRRLHTLRDTAGGRSTTLLQGVSLLELSESGSAIRGWRGSLVRTCGDIPTIYDEDDADASLVRALPARYEAPPVTEEPTPTSTPEVPATEVPTETPEPEPTGDPSDEPTIYLPVAKKDAG